MSYSHRLIAFSLIVAVVLLGACGGEDEVSRTENGSLVLGGTEVEETITRGVNPGTRPLVLNGFNGSIQLRGIEGETASLNLVKKARGRNAEAARALLNEIQIQETGDAQAYRYVMSSQEPARTQVDVQGEVPAGTDVRIELQNGSVELSGITGPITVRQQNGNVRIDGAGGNVEAVTQVGIVEVSFARVPPNADVNLSATNGNVTLSVPANTAARIEAETQVGNIQVGQGLRFTNQSLRPEGAGNAFVGRLGGGNAEVTLHTEIGNIQIDEASAPPPAVAPPPVERAPADSMPEDSISPPASTDTVSSSSTQSV